VAIGLFIIPRTWKLLREAVGILLEGTPAHINLAEVRSAMEPVPGIEAVHDLHVWSITSGVGAMSGHVQVNSTVSSSHVLRQLNDILKERFKLGHTTIQIEEITTAEQACDEAQRHA
jgi:cobalt-zinc-cadmium efflux system protein